MIPVLLPGLTEIPDELLFLREFSSITFESDIADEHALRSLEWGITGRKPSRSHIETTSPLKKRGHAEKANLTDEEDLAVSEQSETTSDTPIRLRSNARTLSKEDIIVILQEKGFFDERLNPKGKYRSDLVVNDDGTITDRATGLMWQQSGSIKKTNFAEAHKYIDSLNTMRAYGYGDWRLPTLEEAASLLTSKAKSWKDGIFFRSYFHIDPRFDNAQEDIWTVDKRDDFTPWYVSFEFGIKTAYGGNDAAWVRACREVY